MRTADYLDRLLLKYSGTFDIYQPYVLLGKEYPAYGYFFSHVEKYVLTRKANMWSSDSFEHILFTTAEELTLELLAEYKKAVTDYMEPQLVRKGEQLPAENHMYSYLSIAAVVEKPLRPEVKRAVKKFKFEKSYMHSIRGFSQAHLAVATMEDEKAYVNRINHASLKIYRNIFDEVKAGKPGYQEILEKQGIESFHQEI